MFITYQQTSEQSYLLNYGEDININTNKKVIFHFNYLVKNKNSFNLDSKYLVVFALDILQY